MNSTYFTQTDMQGTARYMSMGGAFNALGGDATSIGNNPAGLAIYRSSELSITTNLSVNSSKMKTSSSAVSRNDWNFNVNNFAVVANFMSNRSRGLLASNFAFTYNQLKNFHSSRQMKTSHASSSMLSYIAQPYSSDDLYNLAVDAGGIDGATGEPYFGVNDVDNKMSISEDGSLSEMNFAYGGNVNDIFYFGGGIGVRILDYSMRSSFTEDYYANMQGNFRLNNYLETTATGFNFKFGVIVRPVDWLRVGAAIQTPTFYTYSEDNYDSFASSDAPYDDGYISSYGPYGHYSYDINTPLKLNFGLAAVIAKKALISVDYEMEDFSQLDYQEIELDFQNQAIDEDFRAVHTIRVGAEYRITPEFSVRAGYSLSTSPVKKNIDPLNFVVVGTDPQVSVPRDNSFYSLGFGYKARYFFFDAAYVLNVKKNDFYPFPEHPVVKNTSNIHNVVCSFGWRF
jgi:long-subunit fatty acid transport protein